jgi:hypothetical protein
MRFNEGLPKPKRINNLQLQIRANELCMKLGTSVKEKVDAGVLTKDIAGLIGNDYKDLIISNKGLTQDPDRYFDFLISPKGFRLLEKSSISKNEYKYILESNELFLNNEKVGNDFFDDFNNKLDRISNYLMNDKVKIYGKGK